MSNIISRQTAQITVTIPSTFGMPACGRAYAATGIAGVDVVRVKGHLGLAARTNVPGTSAWSPPIC